MLIMDTKKQMMPAWAAKRLNMYLSKTHSKLLDEIMEGTGSDRRGDITRAIERCIECYHAQLFMDKT